MRLTKNTREYLSKRQFYTALMIKKGLAMYNTNGFTSGAKWFFFLAFVILIGAFIFGLSFGNAQWLNGGIASAMAQGMNVQTDITRQKANLDLQALQAQTEAQITQQKQQTAYEAAKQQQELNASAVAATQWANFQAGLYNTLNFGLMAVMIAISVVLVIVGINTSIGLYKILNAKAHAIHPSQPSTAAVHKHQPSPAAQQAREREKASREKQIQVEQLKQLFKDTKVIWPSDDGQSEDRERGSYPLAN